MHPAFGATPQYQIATTSRSAATLLQPVQPRSTGIPLLAYMGVGAAVTVGIWYVLIHRKG